MGVWIVSILYLDCIVLKIRQDKRVLINPFIWRWVSTWKATKNCWACGSRKLKAQNSGCRHSPNYNNARERRSDWLRGWLERFSRSDCGRVSQNANPAVHCAQGAHESLNSVIRRVTKKRKTFPSDESAMKVIYLAIQDAAKRWTLSIRDSKAALNHFMIVFEERLANIV